MAKQKLINVVAVTALSAGLATVVVKTWKEDKSHLSPVQVANLQQQHDSREVSARELVQRWKQIAGIPGVVIAVSKRGQTIWHFADGYADVENSVRIRRTTVMPIGSVSKPIAGLFMMKLVEDGKLNLDKPISEYLNQDVFPNKTWDGQPVEMTLRQLASHTAGIRHYKRGKFRVEMEPIARIGEVIEPELARNGQMSSTEFFSKEHFKSMADALTMFKDDPLVAKPGTKYSYSTFGYTLMSAVVESAIDKEPYGQALERFLQEQLGMTNTYLNLHTRITTNRAKGYTKTLDGQLINAPFVNSSYKWAGGGLMSNVDDLVQFGNIMLYSFKPSPDGRPGFLKRETVDLMWQLNESVKRVNKSFEGHGYGFGWVVYRNARSKFAFGCDPPLPNVFMHGGGAVGSQASLVVDPDNEIVVAVLANMAQAGRISSVAIELAKLFADS